MNKHLTLNGLQTVLPPIKHLIDKKAENIDWNENDPNAKGYVKNRPFYESDPIEENILEEQEISFEDWGGAYGAEISILNQLVVGCSYIVTWDNVAYEFIAKEDSYGNIALEDLNTPFAIYNVEDTYCEIVTSNNATSHVIKIIGLVPNIYKIDKKYIPGILITQGVGKNSEVFNNGQPENATGRVAHAEGYQAKAYGEASHAEGYYTTASGDYSHAEGSNTTASRNCTHAEGFNTKALEVYSHAEGFFTKASGVGSHAEGYYGEATNEYAHAEGYQAKAYGKYSHAEGYNTSTSTTSNASHAEGYSTKSGSIASHTEGYNSLAKSTAYYSHAEGFDTIASSQAQHVQGRYNIEDTSSITNGYSKYAHIVGNGLSSNSRSNAHTLDWDGNAWFKGDVYVGGNSQDEGEKLIKPSEFNILNGEASGSLRTKGATEETDTYKLGMYSFAQGDSTYAQGFAAHAEGRHSSAKGAYSHAEGFAAYANESFSHAEGEYVYANSQHQHVQGKYNILDSVAKYAHIVGNGADQARSNAHTLDWSGNAWYQGDVYVGGTGQDDAAAKRLVAAPLTASVGQTIVVKAVDEKGRPTEWEAVNLVTEARVNELIAAAIAAIPNAEEASF